MFDSWWTAGFLLSSIEGVGSKIECSGQVLVEGMSNLAVLCARAVQADVYGCVTYFTACTTVLCQEVLIAIARMIAYASSECDKLIARHTLNFAL